MKKFLTLLIIATATLAVTTEADARPRYTGHTYVSGRTSCGCTVYSQRFISYYDRCGTPVYSVRRLPVTHRCRSTARPRVHYKHYHSRPAYRSSRPYYHSGYGRGYARSYGRTYSSRGRCR